MNADARKVRSIFLDAVENLAPEQWSAYLDAACAGNEELRRRVEVLLRAHGQPNSLLDLPEKLAATTDGPVAEGPGTVIGPYKLLEQIGQGGFGVVFMAEQTEPVRRKVALKILKPGMDSRQVVARFEAERQALAMMDHPNIAKVFDGGATASGRPFFVMELVKGVPITDYCDQNHFTPRQRLDLFLPVCQAVQHAHQKGIIHRDLKPSNVLVSRHDATPVVKVIDFGVAKALGQELTDKTLFTGIAQMIGTPLYMSPEQAGMSDLDIDTRSDIYSLGALLYELLTGTTPFTKERFKRAAYDDIRRIIREEEPPRPSTRLSESKDSLLSISAQRQTEPAKLTKLVRGELDWIVMKCLEKERQRRYETANGLATDIQRYLADEPVTAGPPSAWYPFRKFARRHKTALMTVAVVVVAVVLTVATLVVSTTITWRANRDLQQALDREHESLERERQNAYYQRIALAEREWSTNNLNRMLQLLDECPPDLRGWEWHYLQRLRLKTLPPLRHESAVFCAAFRPDGQHIASASQDGKVTFWDARTWQQIFQFRAHEKHARSVAFSHDGRLLATTSWDKTVNIWDVQTLASDRNPSPLRTLTHHGVVWNAVFSPDGQRLASAGNRPAPRSGNFAEVKIWDPIAGQGVYTLEGQEREIWSALAFSPDGRTLGTGHIESRDGLVGNVVQLWEANTGQKTRTLAGHTQPIHSLAFSPDGRCLASGGGKPHDFIGADGELKLWDTQTGRERFDLPAQLRVYALAFSPDGRRLVSAGVDQTIKLWDPATGREVLTLRGHRGIVRSLAFSPDGQQLVSASHDMTVRVWDATPLTGQTDPAYRTLRGHQGEVTSVAYSPDGRYLASASLDRMVKIWDQRTGQELQTLTGHPAAVRSVAFSPDGRWLASRSGRDLTVKIWDTTTWKVTRTFQPPGNGNQYIVFSPPDGKLLAMAAADRNEKIVSIWDTTTGQEIHRLRGHSWVVSQLAFDRTGQLLASASADSTVRIWDVRAGKELVTLQPKHAGEATSVAFSPDGRYLASGGQDQTVKIWSTEGWQFLRAISDAHGAIKSVAFASDSQRLAWSGTDSTVKVADASTGQILETFRGHTGWINSIAFSPDGQHIASASADGTVKIWLAPPVPELPAADFRNQEP
jgi:WD40 repeat protein